MGPGVLPGPRAVFAELIDEVMFLEEDGEVFGGSGVFAVRVFLVGVGVEVAEDNGSEALRGIMN